MIHQYSIDNDKFFWIYTVVKDGGCKMILIDIRQKIELCHRTELTELAKILSIHGYSKMKKQN